MAENSKFRVFDKKNPTIRKYCLMVVAGTLSIAEGAKLANVNKESFRRFVNEEKEKLAKVGGGDE